MATYDPNKRYRWTPDTKFEISGAEFGIVLNGLRAILSTAEAQQVLLADKANDVIESALAKAVEAGTVKEAEDEKAND